MFIQQKPYLRSMRRIRVAEGRNLEKGLRLDRNEKVDVWPPEFLAQVFQSKPSCFLSVYPESGALLKKLSRFLDVKEEQVMLTAGIDGALKTLFEILTVPGDKIGVLCPTYAMYHVYSQMFQVEMVEIGYQADLSLNHSQLDDFLNDKPTVLFVPNPNQPIESSFSLVELESLARRALKKNCLLVIDEAYHMFGSETGLPLLAQYENVVILRTFSKGFGVPSIRLGCMVSTENNMDVLAKTRFAHESNALSMAVAEYLLDHYDMVERYLKEVMEGREYVKAELEKLGLKAHGRQGNYLLIQLPSPNAAANLVTFLQNRNIYVKGPWRAPWENCMTITLGPPRLMKGFIDAVKDKIDTLETQEKKA